jgi:hypothetical protein
MSPTERLIEEIQAEFNDAFVKARMTFIDVVQDLPANYGQQAYIDLQSKRRKSCDAAIALRAKRLAELGVE